MSLPSIYELIALLVALGAAGHAFSLFIGPSWSRFECPVCGLTIRFRGVNTEEERFLRLQMYTHEATHQPKESQS